MADQTLEGTYLTGNIAHCTEAWAVQIIVMGEWYFYPKEAGLVLLSFPLKMTWILEWRRKKMLHMDCADCVRFDRPVSKMGSCLEVHCYSESQR